MNSGRVWKCPTCGRTRPGAMATTTGPICRYDLSEMRLVTVAGFPGGGGGGFGGRGRRPGGQGFLEGAPRPPRDPNRDPNSRGPQRRNKRRNERPAAPPGAPPDPLDENEPTSSVPDGAEVGDQPARPKRNRRGRRRGRRPDGTEANGEAPGEQQSTDNSSAPTE